MVGLRTIVSTFHECDERRVIRVERQLIMREKWYIGDVKRKQDGREDCSLRETCTLGSRCRGDSVDDHVECATAEVCVEKHNEMSWKVEVRPRVHIVS